MSTTSRSQPETKLDRNLLRRWWNAARQRDLEVRRNGNHVLHLPLHVAIVIVASLPFFVRPVFPAFVLLIIAMLFTKFEFVVVRDDQKAPGRA